jgi:hypothetical protein
MSDFETETDEEHWLRLARDCKRRIQELVAVHGRGTRPEWVGEEIAMLEGEAKRCRAAAKDAARDAAAHADTSGRGA